MLLSLPSLSWTLHFLKANAALVWRHREEILNFPFQAVLWFSKLKVSFVLWKIAQLDYLYNVWERRQNINYPGVNWWQNNGKFVWLPVKPRSGISPKRKLGKTLSLQRVWSQYKLLSSKKVANNAIALKLVMWSNVAIVGHDLENTFMQFPPLCHQVDFREATSAGSNSLLYITF